jgi:hypothetical protein
MGYDLHITRQENWFDEDNSKIISLQEWKHLVANDPEMRLDNFAEATTTSGDTIRVESDGLSVWTKYSSSGLDGNYAWFDYSNGNIVCKNPDQEIINKMLSIAEQLYAKVQGDEGELYEPTTDEKTTARNSTNNRYDKTSRNKSWWRFW